MESVEAVKKVKQQANSPLYQSNFMRAIQAFAQQGKVELKDDNAVVRTDILQGAVQILQQQHTNTRAISSAIAQESFGQNGVAESQPKPAPKIAAPPIVGPTPLLVAQQTPPLLLGPNSAEKRLRPLEFEKVEPPPKRVRPTVILDLTREDVEEEVRYLKNQLLELQEKYDKLLAMQIALTEFETKKTKRTVVEETVEVKSVTK